MAAVNTTPEALRALALEMFGEAADLYPYDPAGSETWRRAEALENAAITLEEDKRYIEEVDERMKPYLARAWDEGFKSCFHVPPPGFKGNPYREDNR